MLRKGVEHAAYVDDYLAREGDNFLVFSVAMVRAAPDFRDLLSTPRR